MLMRVRERHNEVQVDLSGVAGRQESVLAALSACQRSCTCLGGIGAATTSLSVRARADNMQVRMRASNGQPLDVVEIYRCLRRALVERSRAGVTPSAAI
jgi:hypothetical protein